MRTRGSAITSSGSVSGCQSACEVRVAIEGVVDRAVEEAALRVGTAIEALGPRLQALHVLAQPRHLIAVEHPGEVRVPVPLDRLDLAGQVRLAILPGLEDPHLGASRSRASAQRVALVLDAGANLRRVVAVRGEHCKGDIPPAVNLRPGG